MDSSEIAEVYKDSTVFVTGATGLLGALCVEKLLRSCPEVRRIYVLMRPKKGKEIQKRLEELLDDPIFGPLTEQNADFRHKIKIVSGDISLLHLGICEEDREKLTNEVNFVFHYAATVKFDEKIKVATHINVRGLRENLRLSRQMKHLQAFIHVSTAYSNCIRKEIEEQFYPVPISGENLIELVDRLDDKKLEAITPILLEDYPNTYVFTKCVAEDILKTEGRGLPVALFRPSIITPTAREPLKGWINNVYGVTGVTVGVALGLIRVMNGNVENIIDIVPADYVVNSTIAVGWDIARNRKSQGENEENDKEIDEADVPVYNFVSSPENPLKWSEFERLTEKYGKQVPSEKVIWHKVLLVVKNVTLYKVLLFLLHIVPAYIVDAAAYCLGKKPMFVKGYEKIHKFLNVLAYFSNRQWTFSNDNVRSLYKKMSPQDKETFHFSMGELNWHPYFKDLTKGGRLYLLKDPIDTVKKGAVKYYKVMFAHYALCTALVLLFVQFILVALKWIIKF